MATIVVKNAEYKYRNILLCGRLGLTYVHNHSIPNIAAKDNWNPARITLYGLMMAIIINAKAAIRSDSAARPNIIANITNVAIINARNVATPPPDINTYPINPTQEHIVAGMRAGVRLTNFGMQRNIV